MKEMKPFLLVSVAEPPFFGRFRLRKSEVPEPTPAATKLGRLKLQPKKAAPAPHTKICHFELLEQLIFNVSLFGSYLRFT